MSLLRLRAEEGVRRVALGFLDEARAALVRVRGAEDDEALHDLRVSLRRLRSTLRAHPSAVCGAIPKKRARQLRDLVQFTSAGRDAEVQLAWLDETSESLRASDREGADTWRAQLAHTRDAVYRTLRVEKLDQLEKLIDRLAGDLSEYDVRFVVNAEAHASTFGSLVAASARAEVGELRRSLEQVRAIEDEAIAHEARIVGKRLRYVLEPVRGTVPELDDALPSLKSLQDALGELQDLAVRTAALSQAIETAALDRARTAVGLVVSDAEPDARSSPDSDAQPGLLALLTRAQGRKRELFEEILGDFVRGPGLERVADLVERACAAIEVAAGAPALPTEIERKYLLTGVPPFVRGKPYARLAQGYVPGEAIVERLRKKSDASGTRYFRTVKLGTGLERIEIEEKISRALFTKLWALTEGRRVEKRRYAIEEGGYVWELDVFTDRELVLCEVELRSTAEHPELPAWLAPWVDRDVTGEDAYVNLNLAR